MHNFTPPCLDTTLSLTELGLTAIGQHHTGRHVTVLCLITDKNASCPRGPAAGTSPSHEDPPARPSSSRADGGDSDHPYPHVCVSGLPQALVVVAVFDLGRTLLLADATRLDGVTTIGVSKHCGSHRGSDRWVTVIVGLTTRPARQIDIDPGRSAEVFSDWLNHQPDEFRTGIYRRATEEGQDDHGRANQQAGRYDPR